MKLLSLVWKKYQGKKKRIQKEKQYEEFARIYDEVHKELENKSFQVNLLDSMELGSAEGERDKKLEISFLKTRAINEIITGEYNYVLAPKGCGKSSLFKAYSDRYEAINKIQDKQRCIIIPIKVAFSFQNVLNDNELSDYSIESRWAIFWGIYIIKEIFKEIDKPEYSYRFDSFIKKSKHYEVIRREFNLYDIWDYISKLRLSVTFNLQGQQATISPSFSIENKHKEILLNRFFDDLQSSLSEQASELIILIDRVDDFIVGKQFDMQRKFIQGLYNCVEEIGKYDNINTLLFLRTDLYQYLKIGTGSDKIQMRTINLEWKKNELIDFVCLRILNCNEELAWYKNLKYLYCKEEIYDSINRGDYDNTLKENDLGLISKASQKIIYTFFPRIISHITSQGKIEDIEFVDWMYTHFEDYTRYINLRYLMVFLKNLFKRQFEEYVENLQGNNKINIEYDEESNQYSYNIFSNHCIQDCYEEVQEIAIKNVRSLFPEEATQKCFEEIHERTVEKGVWYYGDLNYKQFEMTKEEYNILLDRLVILGYFKETGKKYTMPILYMKHLKK